MNADTARFKSWNWDDWSETEIFTNTKNCQDSGFSSTVRFLGNVTK